jgi:hypothetical protein
MDNASLPFGPIQSQRGEKESPVVIEQAGLSNEATLVYLVTPADQKYGVRLNVHV